MFGLGLGEIVVILIVALLVLGPEKLPEAAKTIGRTIRELRKHTDNLKETIEQDEHIGGTVRELKSALRGDVFTPARNMVKPQGVVSQPAEPAKKDAASAEMASWDADADTKAEAPGDRATKTTTPDTPAALKAEAKAALPPTDPKNG